jgi:hypothetical protein
MKAKISFVFLFTVNILSAQSHRYEVILNNGERYIGSLVRVDSTLRIATLIDTTGKEFQINMRMIKMQREIDGDPSYQSESLKRANSKAFIIIDYSRGSASINKRDEAGYYSISTSFGSFNSRRLTPGVDFGYDRQNEIISTGLSLNYFLTGNPNSIKLIPLFNTSINVIYNNDFAYNGFSYTFGIGSIIKLSSNFGIQIKYNYEKDILKDQKINIYYGYGSWTSYTREPRISKNEFGVGIIFLLD